MAIEGDDGAVEASALSETADLGYDRPMTKVHTVVRTDRDNGTRPVSRAMSGRNDLHIC
jgi:hypothetical protein